jgi:hypothetical protein
MESQATGKETLRTLATERSHARTTLSFAIYEGDRVVRRDKVAQDIVKVGKDPRSHVRIDDELAARMHAVIEVASPADITLIDLGNGMGTLVNGHRVNKCKLRPGDQIQVGATLVVLESAEVASPFGIANPFAGANPFEDAAARPWAPAVEVGPATDGPMAFGYSMLQSGPAVSPDEVEVAHLSAVEVMVLWETTVLHVSHLTPPRSFFVGEEHGKAGCDYFVPSEALGTTRAPIVVARSAPSLGAALVILPRARGYVELPGEGRISLADLVSSQRARASGEMSGAYEVDLPSGAKAHMEIEGSRLAFRVSAVSPGKRVPMGLLATTEPAALLYTGMSFLLHVGLAAVFAFFMPTMGGSDTEAIDRDDLALLQKLLNAQAERELDERETQPATAANDDHEGGSGAAARGESGTLGSTMTKETGHRYAVQGPRDNPDPHLAKERALQEAAEFGMIGLIPALTGDPNAPTAPWGREQSSGKDDRSALGNMFGETIGEASGTGGLGLSGPGEGGGGRFEGIGLGNFGGLDHGFGRSGGQGIGNGVGGPGGRGHIARAPRIREPGGVDVNGRLPPEIIQRIVRQNFGRFRLCYENGLRASPNLQGRVTVKFVIDRSGAVAMTADAGSDIPDRSVSQCVVRSFANLSFPQPEGGMVTVVYPIMFNPGD